MIIEIPSRPRSRHYTKVAGPEELVLPEIDRLASGGWTLHTFNTIPMVSEVIGGGAQLMIYAVMEMETQQEEEERIIG
jgi:hypothetical protein